MEQTTKDIEWVAEPSSCWLVKRFANSASAEILGPVMTENGVVHIEQWFMYHPGPHWCLHLDFCVNGRQFRRVIERRWPYSKRYIVTLAKRFAEEKIDDFYESICV